MRMLYALALALVFASALTACADVPEHAGGAPVSAPWGYTDFCTRNPTDWRCPHDH